MGRRTREIREAVEAALQLAGAIELRHSVTGDGHQRFDFTVTGVVGRFVFSSTPKSDRAIDNAKAIAKRTVEDYRSGRKGVCQTRGRSLTPQVPSGAWQ